MNDEIKLMFKVALRDADYTASQFECNLSNAKAFVDRGIAQGWFYTDKVIGDENVTMQEICLVVDNRQVHPGDWIVKGKNNAELMIIPDKIFRSLFSYHVR